EETFSARVIKVWPFNFVSVISTDYLKANPQVKERYQAALRDSVYYTVSNPQQAAEWFAEKLRIDAKFVERNPNEDPAFLNVTSADAVNLAITPEVQDFNEKRLALFVETGLLKEPVTLLVE